MPSIAGFWDAAADTFDQEPDHGLLQPEVRAAWTARLTSWMPSAAADVLDLGCGTGTLSLILAGLGHRVTLVDLSARMVGQARAKLAAVGVGPRVVVADAGDPPVAQGVFDVVLARHLLWTLPDPHAALRRWVGLLRPGGRLVLVEGRWTAPGDAPPYVGGAEAMPWMGGVGAEVLTGALRPFVATLRTEPLPDRNLWGKEIHDERFAVVALT
jgi:SAM-dependent methyltransferase